MCFIKLAVKSFLRILLLAGICRFAYDAVVSYVFAFDEGYPFAPLLGMAACFWAFLQLRSPYSPPRPVVYQGLSPNSALFVTLSALAAAFILEIRRESALTNTWCLHFAALTFFQLLIPFIASYAFIRVQTAVAATITFLLVAMLWRGTEMNRSARFPVEHTEAGLCPATSIVIPAANPVQTRPKPGAFKPQTLARRQARAT